jgi:hypothetical protein
MGQAHDQPGRERSVKKKHTRKQSNGPGPIIIGGCAARGLHQPGWSTGVPPKSSAAAYTQTDSNGALGLALAHHP